MKAAVISEADQAPRYGDFEEPVAGEGEQIVTVTAAALTNLARSMAVGAHYSSAGSFPAVAGVDGVGRGEDGQRVYFTRTRAPFGSMAQRCPVSRRSMPVPDELDDVTIAALMNPGVSAWMSLAYRAQLQPGERVLVVGATGVTGRAAVQVAKTLGAGTVIAVGRNRQSLQRVSELGADVTVQLDDQPVARFGEALSEGADVIVDYLWGPATEALLTALQARHTGVPAGSIRLIHVGSMAAPTITLRGDVLRSTDLALLGSGIGSVSPHQMGEAAGQVIAAAVAGKLTVETQAVPLAEVEKAWHTDGRGTRTVFVP